MVPVRARVNSIIHTYSLGHNLLFYLLPNISASQCIPTPYTCWVIILCSWISVSSLTMPSRMVAQSRILQRPGRCGDARHAPSKSKRRQNINWTSGHMASQKRSKAHEYQFTAREAVGPPGRTISGRSSFGSSSWGRCYISFEIMLWVSQMVSVDGPRTKDYGSAGAYISYLILLFPSFLFNKFVSAQNNILPTQIPHRAHYSLVDS